jgi:hypothetical protein
MCCAASLPLPGGFDLPSALRFQKTERIWHKCAIRCTLADYSFSNSNSKELTVKKHFLLCLAAVLLALTVTPTILMADGNPDGPPGGGGHANIASQPGK